MQIVSRRDLTETSLFYGMGYFVAVPHRFTNNKKIETLHIAAHLKGRFNFL